MDRTKAALTKFKDKARSASAEHFTLDRAECPPLEAPPTARSRVQHNPTRLDQRANHSKAVPRAAVALSTDSCAAGAAAALPESKSGARLNLQRAY